jgi:hypothetical protein
VTEVGWFEDEGHDESSLANYLQQLIKRDGGLSLTAALAGRAEQEDNEPDRHGHQCPQQQIRRGGPGEAFPGIVLNTLSRKPHRVHQLVGGHAEKS